MQPTFYVGLQTPAHAEHFSEACISINRLRGRKSPIGPCKVLVDSAAFTELNIHGRYRHAPSAYAAELRRLHEEGIVTITAAVSQDYMCEPFMLERTGLTLEEHQRLTIERYDALLAEDLPFPIMPVLQGYAPMDYVRHIEMYGDRLTSGLWVGVGSVCKRNRSPFEILQVLFAIKEARPDLRLHGFGLKLTSLKHPIVRMLLHSADSMAWSLAARFERDGAGDLAKAKAYADRVEQECQSPPDWFEPNSRLARRALLLRAG